MNMVRVSLICALFVFVGGCSSGSWYQAKFLSGADTKQAIALEESQEPKLCMRAKGSGAAMGVTGYIDVIQARGKSISFQDCMNAMTDAPGTVVLPSRSTP